MCVRDEIGRQCDWRWIAKGRKGEKGAKALIVFIYVLLNMNKDMQFNLSFDDCDYLSERRNYVA